MNGAALDKARRLIQNVPFDLRDNLPSTRQPTAVERAFTRPEESAAILARLFPDADRRELWSQARTLPEHVELRARTAVGDTEKKTRHPHDFIIEKNSRGTAFTFIDPEHYVGTRNFFRPPIGNLMRAFLPANLHDAPSVAIVRFRTPKIAEENPYILKMREQFDHSRDLIERDGLPDFLERFPEEILFRAVVRQASLKDVGKMLVQSRYVNERQEERFLQGLQGADVLEGKIQSQQAIIHRFSQLLRDGAFEELTEVPRAA